MTLIGHVVETMFVGVVSIVAVALILFVSVLVIRALQVMLRSALHRTGIRDYELEHHDDVYGPTFTYDPYNVRVGDSLWIILTLAGLIYGAGVVAKGIV